MWDTYYTPATLDEALHLLAERHKEARIIAGGTDIIIELERKLRTGVHYLIDISRIPGLDSISYEEEDGLIHLGPLVTHNHIVGSDLLGERALPLAQASWSEAAPQIRNRATLAGNLITASPANDTIPPLIALNAAITLQSAARGKRTLRLKDFYTGFRQVDMQPDELVIDVSFKPLTGSDERGVFLKLGLRKAQAISVVNVAVVLRFDGKTIKDAVIAQGSVAPQIVTSEAAESFLTGKTLTDDVIKEAANLASQSASPIDDVRGTAAYRIEMIRALTRQALSALAQGRERVDFPVNPVMLWGPDAGLIKTPLAEGFVHRPEDIIETTINGEKHVIAGGAGKTLLRFLREDAGLTGTKEGCAEGECGACTVFLDGVAVMACMVAAPRAHRAEVVTVEGLKVDGQLHPIQEGFIREGAVQCGYCTPGFLMAGAKLLEERPHPSTWDIQQSITGNLCRCTGYYKIINAFEQAAKIREERGGEP